MRISMSSRLTYTIKLIPGQWGVCVCVRVRVRWGYTENLCLEKKKTKRQNRQTNKQNPKGLSPLHSKTLRNCSLTAPNISIIFCSSMPEDPHFCLFVCFLGNA